VQVNQLKTDLVLFVGVIFFFYHSLQKQLKRSNHWISHWGFALAEIIGGLNVLVSKKKQTKKQKNIVMFGEWAARWILEKMKQVQQRTC